MQPVTDLRLFQVAQERVKFGEVVVGVVARHARIAVQAGGGAK